MPTTKPDLDPRSDNQVLDKALADSFPASDPPAATGLTPAVPPVDVPCIDLYLVVDAGLAATPVEDWRTESQLRWLSPNTPALQMATTPALALLDSYVEHGFKDGGPWVVAHLQCPAPELCRLDTPNERWRERTFRNEVRLHGDRWALEQQSLLLRVPSPLCPGEYNVLVNLLHPKFTQLRLVDTCALELDERLASR